MSFLSVVYTLLGEHFYCSFGMDPSAQQLTQTLVSGFRADH